MQLQFKNTFIRFLKSLLIKLVEANYLIISLKIELKKHKAPHKMGCRWENAVNCTL